METSNDVQPFKELRLKQPIKINTEATFRPVKQVPLGSGLLSIQDQMHPKQ